jgi:hypothetical protein
MLFWFLLEVLALTSLTFAQVGKRRASPRAHLSHRLANDSLDSIEVTAHSRLPNLPLPQEINNSTKTLLQFLAIWTDSETSLLSASINQIAQNASGYADFGVFTRDEVFGILKTNLAVSGFSTTAVQLFGEISNVFIRKPNFSSTTQSISFNTMKSL